MYHIQNLMRPVYMNFRIKVSCFCLFQLMRHETTTQILVVWTAFSIEKINKHSLRRHGGSVGKHIGLGTGRSWVHCKQSSKTNISTNIKHLYIQYRLSQKTKTPISPPIQQHFSIYKRKNVTLSTFILLQMKRLYNVLAPGCYAHALLGCHNILNNCLISFDLYFIKRSMVMSHDTEKV